MGSYWSSEEFINNEDFIEVHKELENNVEIVDTEIPSDIIKRKRKKKRKNRSKNKYGL